MKGKERIINGIILLVFIFYITFIVWCIMFKYITPLVHGDRYFSRSLNLVPFNDIRNGYFNRLDIFGNIILFVPLGIFLSMYGKEKNKYVKYFIPFILSIIFEISQYVFAIGATDITDVILNGLGGLLGIFSYNILGKVVKDKLRLKTVIAILGLIVLIIVAFIVIMLYIYN